MPSPELLGGDLLDRYESRPTGLSEAEVGARLTRFGTNALPVARRSSWRLLLRQFNDVLVYILLVAMALSLIIPFLETRSLAWEQSLDALAILAILVLNAGLGFAQEHRAERAIEGLRKLSAPRSRVRRDGRERMIDSSELVPGDLLILSTGDRISADGLVLRSEQLEVDESSLSGESRPIEKAAPRRDETQDIDVAQAYSGTLVTQGEGELLVTATGLATEMGRIATLVARTEIPKTPLQLRLERLSRLIGLTVLLVCLVVLALVTLSGSPFLYGLLVTASLAVSAVPEGLPAAVTASFALGVNRMAKRHALVRRLDALETLGCVSVICSDKTGTLTQNRMTVAEVWTPSGSRESEELLLEIAASCNRARLPNLGDPTELGLLRHARSQGVQRQAIDALETPFSSESRHMCSRHGERRFVKGAPGTVTAMCVPQPEGLVESALARLTGRGLRVLACAWSEGADLHLAGLIGLEDPPRSGAAEAIAQAGRAGIRTIMITGDNARTAQVIAGAIGLENSQVVSGAELDAMDQAAIEACLRQVSVFARVSPAHKLALLQALQRQQEVVAMTGDGVNDAPALKGAHVGIAMGRDGTEVAREAASIVLADDHYATIVTAVREGRRIYDNIRRFVVYLLRANLDELLFISTALMIGLPLPYLPLHILWINLMTDGLPALALGAEPAEPNIMRRPPRPLKEGILAGEWPALVGSALTAFAITLALYWSLITAGTPLDLARSLTLTTAVLLELAIAFSMRSSRPLWEIGFFSNPWLVWAAMVPIVMHLLVLYTPLVAVFQLQPLLAWHWALALAIASAGFLIFELAKLRPGRRARAGHPDRSGRQDANRSHGQS